MVGRFWQHNDRMPELPEIEVTRRSLAPLQGAQVQALRLGKPLRWPLGTAPERLTGRRLGEPLRRGKYLWLPLEGDGGLLWHLGMSGALVWHPKAQPLAPAGPHDHADLLTTLGTLRLTDPRRFGAVVWSPALDAAPAAGLLARLGPEPFDPALTPARFHAALRGRRTAIKPALLSGELVVGAGNIYAAEALFLAGIDPRTPCARIGPARAERLLAAVREVLGDAIAAGGSTLRNYRSGAGEAGGYQWLARVYGREGQPCVRCGAPVRRIVQGQRATFFCARCQHV